MKQEPENMTEDLSYIQSKIEKEPLTLPEQISEQAIVAAIKGKKQHKNKKAVIRRWVAITVAACLMICSFWIYDAAVYNPKIKPEENEGLVYADSYTQIGALMNDYMKSERFAERFRFNLYAKASGTGMVEESAMDFAADEVAPESASANSTYTKADGVTNDAYSQTNTRVSGIDEADTVKTDGKYLYMLDSQDTVYIVSANQNNPEKIAEINIGEVLDPEKKNNRYGYCKDFFLYNGMLIVSYTDYANGLEEAYGTTSVYRDYYATDENTVYLFFDVKNPQSPTLIQKLSFEGSEVSCRIVNNRLLAVVGYTLNSYDNVKTSDYKTFIPYYQINEESVQYPAPERIAIVNSEEPDSFLTLCQLDLSAVQNQPEVFSVLGNGWDIYCNNSSVYVYYQSYSYDEEYSEEPYESLTKTHILAFDITGNAPVFRAKTCIKGSILNTFSLDEYNGYLRVAVTANANVIYVLDKDLNTVGKSEPLAQGETIQSVRFMGNTAYAVTFYQTDPLFVLDMSNPEQPVLLGELKIPGFSSYLHPVTETLMLGIGQGGTEDGLDGSAKISLFDVSNPKEPKETDSIILPDTWFDSNYHAFVLLDDGSFLLPYTSYSQELSEENGYDYGYSYRETVGLLRFGIENNRLTKLNTYNLPDMNENSSFYYYACRGAYVNNTVFALNLAQGIGVYAFNKQSGEKTGTLELYKTIENDIYPTDTVDTTLPPAYNEIEDEAGDSYGETTPAYEGDSTPGYEGTGVTATVTTPVYEADATVTATSEPTPSTTD